MWQGVGSLMLRVREERVKMLRNAGWRAFKLGKRLKKAAVTLKKAAFKNLPIARRRGEAVYRRAARVLGAPKPVVAEDVVVSLTSFPARIGKVHHVVSSLLDQSAQPHKIVLYLSLCEFPDRSVPKRLTRLEGDRFEVRFVAENLRSHKKLQYALIDFPDAWIATADDDRLYPADWLSRLLRGAAESSGTIICMRGRRMIVSEGRFLPFGDWPFVESAPSFLLFPVGSWGTLYPPGSLNALVGDRELIRKLTPLDDDIWAKAMSLMQDVPCRALGGYFNAPVRFRANIRLWSVNEHLVDETLNNTFGHFGLTADAVLAKEKTLRELLPSAPPMQVADERMASMS
jgi:hypothetical protein